MTTTTQPLTKAQEREILKKIASLIAEAGEDSYIGFAFNGCVQRAETNIENDWALDPQGAIDSANAETARVRKECAEELHNMKLKLLFAEQRACEAERRAREAEQGKARAQMAFDELKARIKAMVA